ncbi:MAG: phosphonate C-P lyase system protein PhnG [Chloroflexales bacterium]|nr:phosphonate C-P lyase system protein PhnG [Chloroflexales bacterium]
MHYPEQPDYLSTLSRSPAAAVKDFAEELLPRLGAVEVLANRTGLVMVPMRDTAQGAAFYLGEVLLAEARVRVGDAEGYGACLGRDLTQALAIALLDAALTAGIHQERIAAFVQAQAAELAAAEQALSSQIEATRVELETF